jgi:hypothetical protein
LGGSQYLIGKASGALASGATPVNKVQSVAFLMKFISLDGFIITHFGADSGAFTVVIREFCNIMNPSSTFILNSKGSNVASTPPPLDIAHSDEIGLNLMCRALDQLNLESLKPFSTHEQVTPEYCDHRMRLCGLYPMMNKYLMVKH